MTANIIPLVRVLSKAARLLMGCRQRFVADDVNTRIQEGVGDRCVHMVWSNDRNRFDTVSSRGLGLRHGLFVTDVIANAVRGRLVQFVFDSGAMIAGHKRCELRQAPLPGRHNIWTGSVMPSYAGSREGGKCI